MIVRPEPPAALRPLAHELRQALRLFDALHMCILPVLRPAEERGAADKDGVRNRGPLPRPQGNARHRRCRLPRRFAPVLAVVVPEDLDTDDERLAVLHVRRRFRAPGGRPELARMNAFPPTTVALVRLRRTDKEAELQPRAVREGGDPQATPRVVRRRPDRSMGPVGRGGCGVVGAGRHRGLSSPLGLRVVADGPEAQHTADARRAEGRRRNGRPGAQRHSAVHAGRPLPADCQVLDAPLDDVRDLPWQDGRGDAGLAHVRRVVHVLVGAFPVHVKAVDGQEPAAVHHGLHPGLRQTELQELLPLQDPVAVVVHGLEARGELGELLVDLGQPALEQPARDACGVPLLRHPVVHPPELPVERRLLPEDIVPFVEGLEGGLVVVEKKVVLAL
mmetsp:Transcript_38623/g.111450  ORF Transcript_38623/g.111450 Transcript_38623/m.111450 type:complete len:390 (-) Transcript_38623:211-1380(-)